MPNKNRMHSLGEWRKKECLKLQSVAQFGYKRLRRRNMSKIIIDNRTDMPIQNAMRYVKHVIDEGKISETAKGKQYCFVTIWNDGVGVYSVKNKQSDKFIVFYESKE